MMYPARIKILVIGLLVCSCLKGNAYQTIDYNELVAFARQLESSIASGNPYYFNNCFNMEVLVERVMENENYTAVSEFDNGFAEGIVREFDLGAVIINETGFNGSFSFIRAFRENGRSKILFRLLSDRGLNYHEYDVEMHNGKFTIVDGYIYLSAQTISNIVENIYNIYRLSLPYNSKSKPDIESLILFHASKGKFAKAYKKWIALPDSIRCSKSSQMLGILVSQKVNRKIYSETYIEFMQFFPEEPAKYLLPLDGLIKHSYFQAALVSIDKLDDIIQTDPLLDFLRANIYYEAGDFTNAEQSLSRLIGTMPDFERGYLSLLGLYLETKKFEKATQLLDMIVLAFSTYKETLIPFLIGHPDFINSTEYKNWLEY